MKRTIATAVALAFLGTAAYADSKPSDEEAGKIKAALAEWGFTGGTYEKETEATGVYEIDDAKAKSGAQYDVKLDKDFKVLSITAD